MHKDIIDPLDAEASGRCVNENEQKSGGDKAVASRARHRTRSSVGVGGDEDGASCARHRTSPSMGVAAKKFAEKWKGRGYEKGETHSFWIEQNKTASCNMHNAVFILLLLHLLKYKQIFMSDKKKIVFNAVRYPIPRGFAIMLLFDNNFLYGKSCRFKNLHHVEAHGDNIPFFAGISHKYRAKLPFLQDTVTFRSNRFHLLQKVFNVQIRQVIRDILPFALILRGK